MNSWKFYCILKFHKNYSIIKYKIELQTQIIIKTVFTTWNEHLDISSCAGWAKILPYIKVSLALQDIWHLCPRSRLGMLALVIRLLSGNGKRNTGPSYVASTQILCKKFLLICPCCPPTPIFPPAGIQTFLNGPDPPYNMPVVPHNDSDNHI